MKLKNVFSLLAALVVLCVGAVLWRLLLPVSLGKAGRRSKLLKQKFRQTVI